MLDFLKKNNLRVFISQKSTTFAVSILTLGNLIFLKDEKDISTFKKKES